MQPIEPMLSAAKPNYSVAIGWDSRESLAFQVCVRSLLAHARVPPAVAPISMTHLGAAYQRPTERRDGRLWDVKSKAYCATEFSLARFWAVAVASSQWVIFCDGDFLWRDDIGRLVECLNPRYALMCVQPDFRPIADEKMDRQVQTVYERKLWSSLMAFNTTHAGTRRLDAHARQTWPGLTLHQMRWLTDAEIGELPREWNFVPGVSSGTASAVHLTYGTPDMGYDSPYSKEWWGYAPTERSGVEVEPERALA